ncbi:MAG: 3-dehydroquinate synthase [Phycisphaerae bacterium]
MQKIHVHVAAVHADYDILVGSDMCREVAEFVVGRFHPHTCAVITDANVAPLHLPKIESALREGGIKPASLIIPAGEQHKNISTLGTIWDFLLDHRWERRLPIIALGGGVVGDMTGFAAATVLRGVPLIQMPTSLLAAVDAGVGGKTGIDHAMGKNLLGAFHHASLVAMDVNFLSTLPRRELISGLAECIKHAVIADENLFHWLEDHLPQVLESNPGDLTELISRNVRIKAEIVTKDPYENSIRAHLNLGHTFGHAMEAVVGYDKLPHGYAVALGMLAAARLAVELGHCESQLSGRLESLIRRAGLPTCIPRVDVQAIHSAMYSDKKVASARLRLILPLKIGEVKVVTDVPEAAILDAIKSVITAGASVR